MRAVRPSDATLRASVATRVEQPQPAVPANTIQSPGIGPVRLVAECRRACVSHRGGGDGLDQIVGNPFPKQRAVDVCGVGGADRDEHRPERTDCGQLPRRGPGLLDPVEVHENEGSRRLGGEGAKSELERPALHLDLAAGEPLAKRPLGLGVGRERLRVEVGGWRRHWRMCTPEREGRC